MDFSLTDEQRALSELAGQILSDRGALDRLKAIEASADGYDRDAWSDLAKAGLLGAALPEAYGGSGGGFLELCLLLEQQGKRVVQLPLVATLAAGALPIARFGSEEQKKRFLPAVARGEALLTAAFAEPGGDERKPATTAKAVGGGFCLTGVKTAVPWAEAAAAMLVPATTDAGVAVFLVDPKAPGMTLAPQSAMSWERESRVELADVAVGAGDVLGGAGQGGTVLEWALERTTTALCAVAAGVCQEAMRITAEYASTRKQFDKPIAMFQAVGQRMADCYVDNEAVNLTMWQAVSRLADELPSAMEVAAAKYWAAEAGSRIGHAGLHIHGGISIDVDYPIHRYFLWAKQIEFTLGAATPQLLRLGDLIAARP